MRAPAAASRSWRVSASVRPVVPITWTRPASAARRASATVAAGAVKSMRPSALFSAARGSSPMGTDELGHARQEPGVLSEGDRARALEGADELAAVRLGDRLDEHAPHAPGRADHHQPHLSHPSVPAQDHECVAIGSIETREPPSTPRKVSMMSASCSRPARAFLEHAAEKWTPLFGRTAGSTSWNQSRAIVSPVRVTAPRRSRRRWRRRPPGRRRRPSRAVRRRGSRRRRGWPWRA